MLVVYHQRGRARMMTAQYAARIALRTWSLWKKRVDGSRRGMVGAGSEFGRRQHGQTLVVAATWSTSARVPSVYDSRQCSLLRLQSPGIPVISHPILAHSWLIMSAAYGGYYPSPSYAYPHANSWRPSDPASTYDVCLAPLPLLDPQIHTSHSGRISILFAGGRLRLPDATGLTMAIQHKTTTDQLTAPTKTLVTTIALQLLIATVPASTNPTPGIARRNGIFPQSRRPGRMHPLHPNQQWADSAAILCWLQESLNPQPRGNKPISNVLRILIRAS